MASYGLARAAKSVPMIAEAQLPQYADALGFTDEDRGRVLYQAALWTAASYEPESAQRLDAVPEIAYDERLHEWRAREAMARSDWPAALAAIRKMGDKQRSEARWQYFEARLAERSGDTAAAQRLYREAANKAEFHGFLAADRIKASYTLCPWQPTSIDAERNAIARDAAIVRALGLYRIDRRGWATREWDDALSRFDDTQRRLAVEVAQAHGWFDRAVFALGKTPGGEARPDELRLYKLRFPLHHDATIRREAARNRLDPAWVAAEIRAESVFDPRARSGANAMGLMQVLPETGAGVAKDLGLSWGGADSLYEPDTNITLGTAYLRQLLDKYGGQPYQAIAATTRVRRPWRAGSRSDRAWIRTSGSKPSATRKRVTTSPACSPSACSTTGASTARPWAWRTACAAASAGRARSSCARSRSHPSRQSRPRPPRRRRRNVIDARGAGRIRMGLIDTLLGHASEKNLDKISADFAPLLAPGEVLQRAFGLIRDLIVFTDRRLIFVNKQGVTGSKVEYLSVPYRNIVMFSIETAGHFDLEAESAHLGIGAGHAADAQPRPQCRRAGNRRPARAARSRPRLGQRAGMTGPRPRLMTAGGRRQRFRGSICLAAGLHRKQMQNPLRLDSRA
jgi:soluble lytic murein transglycosylase-like protein